MADLAEINVAMGKIDERIAKELEKKNNVAPGVDRVIEASLNIANIPTNENGVQQTINNLQLQKQMVIRKTADEQIEDINELEEKRAKGDKAAIKDFAMKTLKKVPGLAAALGTGYSIAQGINIVAPNLYPTLVGFFTGASKMNAFEKFLMVVGSAITPEPVSKGVILAAGAAIGGVVYGVGAGTKAIYKKIKKSHENKKR